MRRAANKVVRRCPRCGDNSPKDLVEGRLRVYWVRVLALVLFTLGAGLIFTQLWLRHPAQAWCEGCRFEFDV